MTAPEARPGRTWVAELGRAVGAEARVCGFATPTSAGLALTDPTGTVTLLGGPGGGGPPGRGILAGSAVVATGRVVGSGDRPALEVDTLEVLGPAVDPPPLGSGASLEERLDWRYLELRQPRHRLVFEVQTTLERAMRQWWHEHRFLEIHSPKLKGVPNQSGRELFTLDYFGRPAYLAQSPQFYKQMAMAAGFERVFEVGPVFRANPLRTTRHDTEFTSVDMELAWIDSHHDVMALEERWLREAVAAVVAEHGPAIEEHYGRRLRVPEVPFPRVSMGEAQRVLAGKGHVSTAAEGDLDAEGERLLGEHVRAEVDHELVFVTEYPASVRPFYHRRLEEGSPLTRSFDLLWNGLEVTTGAQREHRHDRLVAQAGERNPSRLEAARPYLDFFRHGCPPHGGCGVGLTRLLACLLGVTDVREVTLLPRDRDRLGP